MKKITVLAAGLAAALVSFATSSIEPAANRLAASESNWQMAGLSWRCGKNNPAMWGTFGNGCLKQKRKAKKKQSSTQQLGKSKTEIKR